MGCEIGSIYQRLLETPQPSESWFVIGSEDVFFSVIATESEKDQEVLCQLWKEHSEEDEAEREESTQSESERVPKEEEEELSVEEAISVNFERLQELLYCKCGISVCQFEWVCDSLGKTREIDSNSQYLAAHRSSQIE